MKRAALVSLAILLCACNEKDNTSQGYEAFVANQSSQVSQEELQAKLSDAVFENDPEEVANLFQQGLDPKSPLSEAKLEQAVVENYSEIALLMMEQGVPIRGVNYNLLHVAAGNNNLELVKALLEAGSDIEQASPGGITAVMLSNGEVLNYLVDRGANTLAVSEDGRSALRQAIYDNNADLVNELIIKGAELNGCLHSCEMPPLILAAALDDLTIAKALLDAGASTEVFTMDGENPVIMAASTGNLEMIKFLMGKGIPASIKGYRGGTALDAAISSGNVSAAKYLNEIGIKSDARMYIIGHLHSTARTNNIEMAKFIVSLEYDVNEVSREGLTPVMYAVQAKEFEMAKQLHKLGAKFSQGKQDSPPVYQYMSAGSIEFADYVYKAEPNVYKRHRGYALAGALSTGDPKFYEFLEKRKLLPDSPLSEDETSTLLYSIDGNLGRFPEEIFIKIFRSNILTFKSDLANHGLKKIIEETIKSGKITLLRSMGDGGAPIANSDPVFDTPILMAIAHDKYEFLTYLIDKGADINLPAGWDKTTPLNFAAEKGRVEMVELLLSEGAKLAVLNNDGENDIQVAAKDCKVHELLIAAYDKASLPLNLSANTRDWLKVDCGIEVSQSPSG